MVDHQRSILDWVVTILGVILIAIAILVLGADAQLSFEASEPRYKPLGEYWYELHRGSYNGIQVLLERYLWPPLWDPLLLGIIQWPVWALTGPIGILMFAYGRR